MNTLNTKEMKSIMNGDDNVIITDKEFRTLNNMVFIETHECNECRKTFNPYECIKLQDGKYIDKDCLSTYYLL